MLIERTLFGTINKVSNAIDILQQNEPPEGYYLAFSGGKDSVVTLDLVKRAGVKFEATYHVMTIEPPELIPFIEDNFPEVKLHYPEKDMFELIVENGIPPLRQIRYCQRILKGTFGNDRIKITGLRADESYKRRQRQQVEIDYTKKIGTIHPVFYFSETDIWDYIRKYNVPYCRLYDLGFKRLSCLFCPFEKKSQVEMDLKFFPDVAQKLIDACQKAIDVRRGTPNEIKKFQTGEEMFYWWIDHDKSKPPKDRILDNLFDDLLGSD